MKQIYQDLLDSIPKEIMSTVVRPGCFFRGMFEHALGAKFEDMPYRRIRKRLTYNRDWEIGWNHANDTGRDIHRRCIQCNERIIKKEPTPMIVYLVMKFCDYDCCKEYRKTYPLKREKRLTKGYERGMYGYDKNHKIIAKMCGNPKHEGYLSLDSFDVNKSGKRFNYCIECRENNVPDIRVVAGELEDYRNEIKLMNLKELNKEMNNIRGAYQNNFKSNADHDPPWGFVDNIKLERRLNKQAVMVQAEMTRRPGE